MRAGTGGSDRLLLDRGPQRRSARILTIVEQRVLVGGEREADMGRGIDERLARLLEHAQMADRRGEHDAEFLRLRRAGIVDDAAIGFEEDRRRAHREEVGQRLRHRRLQRLERHAKAPGAGEDGGRIDAEGEAEPGRIDTASCGRASPSSRPRRGWPDGRRCADGPCRSERRQARRERLGRGGKAIAERVRRALEDEREAVGAIGEVVQRLRVGARGVGVVDALQDLPLGGAAGAHLQARRVDFSSATRGDAEGATARRSSQLSRFIAGNDLVPTLAASISTLPLAARMQPVRDELKDAGPRTQRGSMRMASFARAMLHKRPNEEAAT